MDIPSTDRLLKGHEVARYLNISRALAYRLMQRGDIKTIKFGKSVRVAKNDLETFVEIHKKGEGSN